MSSPAQPLRHLDALTGLRGIAAWMVVLFHVRLSLTSLLPSWVVTALSKGYLAVDLFFMLSGFVLWYNYADRLRGGGRAAILDFFWRRFARIWPLHGFIMAIFVVYALALVARGNDTNLFPFDMLPLHFLLVQNWGLTTRLTWNHPAWSISTELAAYLVFPLFVAALRWERLGTLALSVICGTLLGSVTLLFAWHGYDNLGSDITGLGLPRCLLEFGAGCLLCMLWGHWREQRFAGFIAASVCALSLIAGWQLHLSETAIVPLAFASGLMALALSHNFLTRILGRGTVLYLGEISYSTYLAHFLLFIVFKQLFVNAGLQMGWLGLLGFLAIVLAVSMALYRVVEKPAQRWLNQHPPHRGVAAKPVTG
ncbi:MAG: acyltransferase [Novosphingobium sp.]